jgi:hypothetical protein
MSAFRDRIVEFRRVPANELTPNPRNWRKHPEKQRAVLKGMLEEVGFAGAELCRVLPDGSLMLIDGHLRQDVMGEQEIPCLITDLDEAEADKILATYDPLSAMADADAGKLDELLREVETGSEAVAEMLAELATKSGVIPEEESADQSGDVTSSFSIIITCESEDQQVELLEQLEQEGLNCRALLA